MNYWLMKTEPSAFSIDDLKKKSVEHWDGVRNYAARNNIQQMKKGDQVQIYHSGKEQKGVVGLATVAKEAYPDFTAWDPKNSHFDARSTPDNPIWFMVDVKFQRKFARCVTLAEIKNIPELKKMALIKRGRLSVQPVSLAEFELITALAQPITL